MDSISPRPGIRVIQASSYPCPGGLRSRPELFECAECRLTYLQLGRLQQSQSVRRRQPRILGPLLQPTRPLEARPPTPRFDEDPIGLPTKLSGEKSGGFGAVHGSESA